MDNRGQLRFLEELTALTHKHRIYVSITLNKDGEFNEDIYMGELESHMNAAGYILQNNGSIVFTWY